MGDQKIWTVAILGTGGGLQHRRTGTLVRVFDWPEPEPDPLPGLEVGVVGFEPEPEFDPLLELEPEVDEPPFEPDERFVVPLAESVKPLAVEPPVDDVFLSADFADLVAWTAISATDKATTRPATTMIATPSQRPRFRSISAGCGDVMIGLLSALVALCDARCRTLFQAAFGRSEGRRGPCRMCF